MKTKNNLKTTEQLLINLVTAQEELREAKRKYEHKQFQVSQALRAIITEGQLVINKQRIAQNLQPKYPKIQQEQDKERLLDLIQLHI